MTFWQIFVRVLPWRPVPALAALWWHLTGKRLRACNRLRVAGAALPFAYKLWMRNIERSASFDNSEVTQQRAWAWKPSFDVIVDCRGHGPEAAHQTIRSVESQSYPGATLKLIHEHAPEEQPSFTTWQAAVAASRCDFIVPVTVGDRLSRWALLRFAEALQADRTADIVYGDEDELDERGHRRKPWFKPRWNEELFLAQDYLSRACAIRTRLVQESPSELELGPEIASLELSLGAIRVAQGPIVHVPHIVTHVNRAHLPAAQLARIDAVARYTAQAGATATSGPHATVKVSWPLPADLPLVSIIVPTRDKVELLEACVESLLSSTTYVPYELLIIDNASLESKTIEYLNSVSADRRVRVLSYRHPYNYSAINNFAARKADGSYLCLLNNDTEVVEPDWLTEMIRYAVRDEIGAVGAKLLYSDRTIQHAGVVVGIGDAAGHAHRNLPAGEKGYFCQAHVPQYVSAVTGACLVVDKRKFLAVGGLDETALPIAFNDVDLCLKLERAGWRNVYVPHAVLIHHESKSRPKDNAPSQINRYQRELSSFQDRWGSKSYQDPLLNPNLDRSSETFVIRF
jgi:GT2 family glycosyltransferase